MSGKWTSRITIDQKDNEGWEATRLFDASMDETWPAGASESEAISRLKYSWGTSLGDVERELCRVERWQFVAWKASRQIAIRIGTDIYLPGYDTTLATPMKASQFFYAQQITSSYAGTPVAFTAIRDDFSAPVEIELLIGAPSAVSE